MTWLTNERKSYIMKKLASCLIVFAILCSNICGVLADSTVNENGFIKVSNGLYELSLPDGNKFSVIYASSNNYHVNALENTPTDYDPQQNIVLVSELASSDIYYNAKSQLEEGSSIFIVGEEKSYEEIAMDLEIDKNYVTIENDDLNRIGIMVYSIGDTTVFNGVYYYNSDPNTKISEKAMLSNSLLAAAKTIIQGHTFKNDIQFSTVNDSSYEDIVDQKTLVYYRGSTPTVNMTVTQIQMPKGYIRYNGNRQFFWNTRGIISIDPIGINIVTQYNIRMHCNIQGHNLVDYSPLLNTNISENYGVSVGAEFAFNSSWTFDSFGQTFYPTQGETPQVRDWLVVCNNYIYGMSRTSEPGISCTSANPEGQRGSFTKLTYGGTELEVGSWW